MATTQTIATAEPAPAQQPQPRGLPPKAPLAEAEAPRSPSPVSPLTTVAQGYERQREDRIRKNRERMHKMGLLDLANTFNLSATPAGTGTGRGRWRRKPETPGSDSAAPRIKPAAPLPVRRSLRLTSAEPVSYAEIPTKKEKQERGSAFSIEHGCKEEIYTEEHEKLLGKCEAPWTLFVDGYDRDGKRIYDQVRGQTCHQCRQKTLGHHTRCCNCQIVQGQFCGDCLYMRYGENVLEAKKNPNWTCPVCRGICNCSICRTKRGWFPTGNAYRKVVRLGYKSVAHYLIATQRAGANSEDSSYADSNELPSTDEVSEHAQDAKQGLEDAADMSSKVMNVQTEGSRKAAVEGVTRANAPGKKITSDVCKDDSRSESGVTFDSLDGQANHDIGCVTPSKREPKRRKKLVERSPDCVASRLRSRSAKS
ncbi:uncharacterized protein [Lolium perenne]|uniref:uncharacterized protein n=1 Tax=Lolium perenne TaxID=4522 RepID=UPI0021F57A87|nr:uncharacterized protein LOC127295156 [Lolium perenne]